VQADSVMASNADTHSPAALRLQDDNSDVSINQDPFIAMKSMNSWEIWQSTATMVPVSTYGQSQNAEVDAQLPLIVPLVG
jgi:hypothetical protein